MKLVAYHRVSTKKQQASGLGLEAQEQAIRTYVEAHPLAVVLASFTEVESGRKDDRPELEEALKLAQATGSTLIIAKLDRLSRSVSFLGKLQEDGVKFLAVDMPEANEFTVNIMAAVARQEAQAISRRTKEALAAAKARGVKLGNPNGAAALLRAGHGNKYGVKKAIENADRYASRMKPFIEQITASGITTLRAIGAELERQHFETRSGKKQWQANTVRNLLRRIDDMGVKKEAV